MRGDRLLDTTSVVIPALNEEATVGDVIRSVAEDRPLEIIVIDSDSTDNTAEVARRAGARVVNWRAAVPEIPPRPGKGEALWRGAAVARGELLAFVDADLTEPPRHIVRRLVEPFADPVVQLVKAAYRRPLGSNPTGGGRVTALTAQPLLKELFPELSAVSQPLAGEYALRAQAARGLSFVDGYGVEVGLLIDVYKTYGVHAIVEANLGVRAHRNRPLDELADMADIVTQTILSRACVTQRELGQRPPLDNVI